jgi:hypothetical protein
MQRSIICLLIALAFWQYRNGGGIAPAPKPVPSPAPGGVAELATIAGTMAAADKKSLHQAYDILSSGIANDTAQDPVFSRLDQVRQAHRAALLMVWSAAGNKPDKYPGLGAALDSLLKAEIGDTDAPLSPSIRAKVVDLFARISQSFK